RSHPGVAHIGKDNFARAARRDHLVVDQIGSGASKRQILLALSNHFMPRGKRDEVGKARRVDNITIVHMFCNGFGEWNEFGHYFFPCCSFFAFGISLLTMLNLPLGVTFLLNWPRKMKPKMMRTKLQQK